MSASGGSSRPGPERPWERGSGLDGTPGGLGSQGARAGQTVAAVTYSRPAWPSFRSTPASIAWLQDPPGRGRPNAGVVVDPDGVTVVDTLMTPDQYEPFAAEVEALGLPVRRTVLTGSSVEQAGGTGRFKLAAVYGSRQASVHLDQPPNVDSWRALYPAARRPRSTTS